MGNQSLEELNRFRHLMRGFDHMTPNTGPSEYVYMNLKSDLFRNLYFERLTELVDLGLAGPFLSIASKGHCDYLFAERRLEDVRDADSFLEYCLNIGEEYRDAVQSEKARSPDEEADQDMLLKQADLIEELSQLAHSILMRRSLESGGEK